MTPVVNAEKLRAAIAALPDPAKEAVKALFVAEGWPKLTEPWEPEALWGAAEKMRVAAEGAGYVNWMTPLDTAPLLERILALPDDLKDLASDNAKDAAVPSVKLPDQWTVEHWEAADEAVTHAEGLAARRHRHAMAIFADLTAEACDGEREPMEALRHSIIETVTRGRTTSSKMLTGPEVRYLASLSDASKAGLPISYEAYTPDWAAEAKRYNVKIPDLVKAGREWAKTKGLPFPSGSGVKCLDAIIETADGKLATGPSAHRIIAHLLLAADDGDTLTSLTKAGVEEMAAAPEPVVQPEDADIQAMLAEADEVQLLPAERPAVDPADIVAAAAAIIPSLTTVEDRDIVLARLSDLEDNQKRVLSALDVVMAALKTITAAGTAAAAAIAVVPGVANLADVAQSAS